MKRNLIVVISLALVLVLGFSSVALAAVYSSRYSDNTLKRSSTVKTVVKNAQADLTKNTNYTLTHDGIFGGQTERAAIEFQTAKGLDPDGQVGMYTKTVLYPLRDTYYNY